MSANPENKPNVSLRPIDADDLPHLLALNNRHSTELSILSEKDLAALVAKSIRAAVVNNRAGFAITLDHNAMYNSPNFQWFKQRFTFFAYIDRVVVAAEARKLGIGTLLYGDVIRTASELGLRNICCEVNIDPPNPISDLFHKSLGFREIGQAWVETSHKTVRYMLRAA